jgi:hypothetical protein
MENGRTLGFRGDETVKYADVVSREEAMTMNTAFGKSGHATSSSIFTKEV